MKTITTNPRSAAIISFLLALPGAILLLLFMLHIAPPLGPLEPLVAMPADRPNVIGSAIALGLIVLLPAVAFIINLAPIVRAGKRITAYPASLVVAVAILLLIATVVGAVVVDQYPCWIGVPNCD